MKKVIDLTLYNIGQAKGFILVVALLQILLQLGLKVKTLATTGLLTGQLRIVSPDIVKQVVLDQLSIGLPVFFAGTAILVYSAVIWSREWSSKGSFIYRLLMLPGSRFGIYWAKLLTMLVITFFLQAVQVVGVFLNYYLTSFFIPEFAQYHITPWSLVTNSMAMPLLVPQYAVQFLLILTMGVALIVTVFQLAILVFGVEKKGYVRKVTSVVVYILVVVVLFTLIMRTQFVVRLIGNEAMVFLIGSMLIWIVLNMLLSDYLLNHKVSV